MPADCRIRILGEDVANQIAAGEVVERPASVVKELLENAADAGATRIAVEIEDGGRRLIRVTDNGCGMTAQEAVLALQRHATSKITSADDLSSVRTLGFRGEALPSVASVSRLTLVTRPRGEVEGVRLEAEGGEIRELEPTAAPDGTSVIIRDLFFNTPARLKFLRSVRTELAQILDATTRLALSRPGIALSLTADGEETLQVPASADPLNTVAAIYGREVARDLLPVAFGRLGIAVEGFISKPTLTRPTRSGQAFFVNGRWVRNRTLVHALDEGFRSAMPSGRHPFAVLHVELDPALVDVNVHPTKAEVRFLRDWEVHRAVMDAVRESVGRPATAAPLTQASTLSAEQLAHGPWLPPAEGSPRPPDPSDPFDTPDPGGIPSAAGSPPERTPTVLQPPLLEVPAGAPTRPVAQLWNSYVLAESGTGLVLVDQHLAHERVLFDRLTATAAGAADAPGGGTHRLPAPLTLQLPRREALCVEEWCGELRRAGFELETFGRDAWVVRGVPEFVAPGSELAVLRQILDELSASRRIGGELPDRIVATAACRAAVKKGARLAHEEMRQLLADLARSSNPHTCPHGCPISVEITFHELLRRFKRI